MRLGAVFWGAVVQGMLLGTGLRSVSMSFSVRLFGLQARFPMVGMQGTCSWPATSSLSSPMDL